MVVKPTRAGLTRAAQLIREGGVVAFPTDTVYGLGCDLMNKNAIERLYEPELKRLCVDLSGVTFIDSTGIGCLIHADLQCRKQDIRLEIVPGTATLNLIRLTHLGKHLPLTEPVSVERS